jgi:transposase
MPKIDYPNVIDEGVEELEKLEKHHRYSHLFHRVRMLRLLKSEECNNLSEAAQALGYSWRQCQRWFAAYQEGGKRELLVSRVDERGPKELITEEAWQELEEAMKRGEISTVAEAYEFLVERGRASQGARAPAGAPRAWAPTDGRAVATNPTVLLVGT